MKTFANFEKLNDDTMNYKAFNDCFAVSVRPDAIIEDCKFVFIDKKITQPKVIVRHQNDMPYVHAYVLASIEDLTKEMAQDLLGVDNSPIYLTHMPLVFSRDIAVKVVKVFSA